jgi:D-alanyl-D-alanine carboxypeptidase/D-alanyl-D-alanine-endopeptidase (penicillin-binding protein 4)
MLDSAGIEVSDSPATVRLEPKVSFNGLVLIDETISPPLKDIIEVLNHESVNLFAEHLVKEMDKKINGNGTTNGGIEIIKRFLAGLGLDNAGFFLEDGSGLSPLNAVSSEGMTGLLQYMRTSSRYFNNYYASFPIAGSEGTLKNNFRDEIFKSNLRAKSGSMTRVRSYAGYFRTRSDKEMVFSIIINNYSGPAGNIVNKIEDILRETILSN